MSLIVSNRIREAKAAMFKTWEETLTSYESVVGDLIMEKSTNDESFIHIFNGGMSGPKEWKGEREIESVKIEDIAGKVRPFYKSVAIPEVDFLSDNVIDTVVDKAVRLSETAAVLKDSLVADILNNAHTLDEARYTNYDGLATFRSTGSNPNYFGGRVLNATNLEAAYSDFLAMKNEEGRILNVTPKYLIVPQNLKIAAMKLINTELSGGGDSNVFYNALEIICLPELDGSAWFLATDHGDKPFCYHVLQNPQLTITDAPDSPARLYHKRVEYHWDAYAEIMAGPYQLLQKNKTTAL